MLPRGGCGKLLFTEQDESIRAGSVSNGSSPVAYAAGCDSAATHATRAVQNLAQHESRASALRATQQRTHLSQYRQREILRARWRDGGRRRCLGDRLLNRSRDRHSDRRRFGRRHCRCDARRRLARFRDTFAQGRSRDDRARRRDGESALAFLRLAAAPGFFQEAIEIRHGAARWSAPHGAAWPASAPLVALLLALEERAEDPHAERDQRDNQDFPVHI